MVSFKNNEQRRIFLQFQALFIKYIKNNGKLNISISTKSTVTHLENVLVDHIIFSADHFVIKNKFGEIELFINFFEVNDTEVAYDEMDNSYYFKCDDTEVIFEFID